MIKAEERFMSEGQGYFGSSENPDTITHCNVWDWDQLRMIKVKGTARLFPCDEDNEVAILAQFADYLSPQVRTVSVDNDGLLSEVSTNPEEDDTIFLAYLPLSIATSLQNCPLVYYSRLQELDRLGPGVDLSSYHDESSQAGVTQKVAFKFNPTGKPRRVQMAWDEINVLKSLPPHPNILPLDRIVLEDVESRVIGFTTKYIPGGTLDNRELPFRFEWLQQLTQLVDFLNLDLGIMHQDIAPRNLLVDPETQKILLFDFDWVACGKTNLLDGRDDVTGVVLTLYELITGDERFTSIPHWDRNIDIALDVPVWTCCRELDRDVLTFRHFLEQWLTTRTSDGRNVDLDRYFQAPNQLTWPELPSPPDYDVPFESGVTPEGQTVWVTGLRSRRTAMKKGQYVFRWERPPQSRLKPQNVA